MRNEHELRIVVNAKNNASSTLDRVNRDLGVHSVAIDRVSARATAMAAVVANVAVKAFNKLTDAATGVVRTGFSFNNAVEQAETKLMAFTGNAEQVAKTLAWVKDEAAKTQFGFTDMAEAAASLTPVAKMSGERLEDLIRQAEILASINPAEGLSGAVFSLREALTGDWVSIVDRFNLPRKRINELKAQGVPAMEIITRTLKEMGITYDLVAKQGQTTAARWDQIKDQFQMLAGEFAKPIFDSVSNGLKGVADWLDRVKPSLQDTARRFGLFFETLIGGDPTLREGEERFASYVEWLLRTRDAVMEVAERVAGYLGPRLRDLWDVVHEQLIPVLQRLWHEVLAPLLPVIGVALVAAIGAAIDALRFLIELGSGLVSVWLDLVEKAKQFATGVRAAFDWVLDKGRQFKAWYDALPDDMKQAFNRVVDVFFGPLDDVFRTIIAKAGKVREAIKSIAPSNSSSTSGSFLRTVLSAIPGGSLLGLGARATGGPVSRGEAYVVGERRPEVFVPNTSGRIDPQPATGTEVHNNLYGTFNFYTAESVDRFFERLDKTQRLARMGMAA